MTITNFHIKISIYLWIFIFDELLYHCAVCLGSTQTGNWDISRILYMIHLYTVNLFIMLIENFVVL